MTERETWELARQIAHKAAVEYSEPRYPAIVSKALVDLAIKFADRRDAAQ